MKLCRLSVAILLIICYFSKTALAKNDIVNNGDNFRYGYADLVDTLTPAVVNISTTQLEDDKVINPLEDLFGDNQILEQEFKQILSELGNKPIQKRSNSLGSGFIFDKNGYVVTNYHVIKGAQEIKIKLYDKTESSAKIIGYDTKTDLAVLKIDTKKDLPFVKFGSSNDVRVGDIIIAIGNPFGLGETVTSGIISAKSRNLGAGPFDDFLQTDAAINVGNSGGPIFNLKGEVVGINTAIFSPSGGNVGISFAIPSSMAEAIIEQLKASKKIKRGWLGVSISDVTKEMADSLGLKEDIGAFVNSVTKDSPANKAGIIEGDVILKFDDKTIKEMPELPKVVANTPIGKTVIIEVWRFGIVLKVKAKISQMHEDDDEKTARLLTNGPAINMNNSKTAFGLKLKDKFNIGNTNIAGLVVIGFDEASKLYMNSYFKVGDIIVQIGQNKIATIADFQKYINAARSGGRKYVLCKFFRNGIAKFQAIPIAGDN